MSQETQPTPIQINLSDIRLDPTSSSSRQAPAYFDQSQVNPYFRQEQQLQQQQQQQGMFMVQQPMNGALFGMNNNFEDLLSQQSLHLNLDTMGFNTPFQSLPGQPPYDYRNNMNQFQGNSNINNLQSYIPNGNYNINSSRYGMPKQFYQLDERQQLDQYQMNPQQQQQQQLQQPNNNNHHNYNRNNKDHSNNYNNNNNNHGNNEKRHHGQQKYQQQQHQQQSQLKNYQQQQQQFGNSNNTNTNSKNGQRTSANNHNQFSNFTNQGYANQQHHNNQKQYFDSNNPSKAPSYKYQPKTILQDPSSNPQQQYQPSQQLKQSRRQSDQEESQDDYQTLYPSSQQQLQQQQQLSPSDSNNSSKVHVSELKVQLCQRKDKHERKKCQFYHSEEDRRRNPEKYSYSMNLCPNQSGKYSQGDNNCPLGDDCPQAHNKVERLYHPLRYKAKFCEDFKSRGSCSYGAYCSFAHEDSEIVIPMIDKLKQDAIFFMYFYKTVWCPNISEHVRGDCPYIHNVQDFRRDPKQQKLEPRQCEEWKKDNIKTYYQGQCQKQLACEHCHGWKELSNHPMVYKTKPCNIANCNQSAECVMYHSDSDKRVVTAELLAEEERLAHTILIQLFKGKTNYDFQLGAPFETFFSEEELSKNAEPFNSSNHTNNHQPYITNNNNNNYSSNQTQSNQPKNNAVHHRIKAQNTHNNGANYNPKNNHNHNHNLSSQNHQYHNELPPSSQYYQQQQQHKHNQRGQQTYLPKASYQQAQQQQMNASPAQTSYFPRNQLENVKEQRETAVTANPPVETNNPGHNEGSQQLKLKNAANFTSETQDEVVQIKPTVNSSITTTTATGNIKEFNNFESQDNDNIGSNQADNNNNNNSFLNQFILDSPPSSASKTSATQKGSNNFLAGIAKQSSNKLVSPVTALNVNVNTAIEPINSSSSNSNNNKNYQQSGHGCSCHFGGVSKGQKCSNCGSQGMGLIQAFSPYDQLDSSHFQDIASVFSQNEGSKTNSERAYSRDSSVSKDDISANTTLNHFNYSHQAPSLPLPASASSYSLAATQIQLQQSGNCTQTIKTLQQQKQQQGSSLINCFNISSPPDNLTNSRKDSGYAGAITAPLQTNFDSTEKNKKAKEIEFFAALSEEQIKLLSTSDNLQFLNAGQKKVLSTLADHYEYQDIQNLCNAAAKDNFQNSD